jgi:hypothetical protein
MEGTFVNGVIVPDDPTQLREGMRIQIVPVEARSEPTLLSLLEFAGQASELPEDMAAQHDHYLHGMPKR